METSQSEGETGHDTSWLGKSAKRRRNDSPILLNNRYSPLATDENDNADCASATVTVTDNDVAGTNNHRGDTVELITPPFYIDDVEKINGMINKFTQLAGENTFACRSQADGSIRVASKTIATYNILTQFCKDLKIAFHTYQVKSEKSFDVIINGLHKSFKIDDLRLPEKKRAHCPVGGVPTKASL